MSFSANRRSRILHATLKTFFLAKTRKCYYHIHTSVAPNPQTHIRPGGMHVVVVGRAQALGSAPPPPRPNTPPAATNTHVC